MNQPHLQIRVELLTDHMAKGWMDGDMYLAYNIMLHFCDWNTGIWHGSADSLAAKVGGQWSKSTAKRVLRRLCLGRYITSRHIPKQMGNYDIAINKYIPTIGPNMGKKLRRTKTQDYRLWLTNKPEGFGHDPLDSSPNTPEGVTSEPLPDDPRGSPVTRIQDLHFTPPASGESGVGVRVSSEATVRPRIANAIAGAHPVVPENPASQKARTQPQPVAQPEAPLVTQEEFEAHLEDPAVWLANYLWMFIQARPDIEIMRPWEKFWANDFRKALSDGYSFEDLKLAILTSQIPACRHMYFRGEGICKQLDLLIEKGRTLVERGVLREHACECGLLFAMREDLKEHQETCEDQLPIDPEDAAEEEEMYEAEDLCDFDLQADPVPDFDPFAGEREGENWQ